MENKQDKELMARELEAQLKQLRTVLHQTIEDAMLKIARTCAGVSPDMFAQVIASVFNEFQAVAAPAMATERPSPKRTAKKSAEPKRRGRHAVWANSSEKSLRLAYQRRIRNGQAIEPDLEAELVKRFPYYDATTHKFMGATARAPRKSDWTNSSDGALRQAYGDRMRAGKAIEPALESELARRFESYDVETHKFTGRSRKSDWTKSTDNSLRLAYSSRTRSGKALEPELEAELARRFTTYDITTHKFTGRVRKEKVATAPKTSVASVPMGRIINEILSFAHLHSYQNKAGNHLLMFDGEKMLLRGGVAPFELVLLDKKTKTAVVRKLAKDSKHKLYIIKCKKGKVVEEMKMGARDIKYIPATRQLLAREAVEGITRYIAFNPDGQTEIWSVAPTIANMVSIRARQTDITETLVIEEDGTINAYQLIRTADTNKAPVKIKTNVAPAPKPAPKPTSVKTAPVVNPHPMPKPAQPTRAPDAAAMEQEALDVLRDIEMGNIPTMRKAPKPAAVALAKPKGELQISVNPTRMSLDGTYSDITVNGKRILHDHIDTTVQLFLGGTVLGIHGIVTDNPDLPTKPMWQVFDTELRPRTFSQRHMFTKKQVYIEKIRPMGEDKIILEVSNKMRIILEKRNTAAIFKIMENTK